MKTVRFAQLVERFGRPHVHAFWVAPKDDAEFQRARKAERVLTVEPTRRGKADTGVVGFEENKQQGSQILIFPKSLKPVSGARVIGIKFDLLDQPPLLPPDAHDRWAPPKKKKSAGKPATRRAPPPPASRSEHDGGTAEIPTRKSSPPAETAAETTLPGSRHRARPPEGAKRKSPPAHSDRLRPPLVDAAATKAKGTAAPLPTKLVAELRAALEELRDGKTVAAYQRLQRLLGDGAES